MVRINLYQLISVCIPFSYHSSSETVTKSSITFENFDIQLDMPIAWNMSSFRSCLPPRHIDTLRVMRISQSHALRIFVSTLMACQSLL